MILPILERAIVVCAVHRVRDRSSQRISGRDTTDHDSPVIVSEKTPHVLSKIRKLEIRQRCERHASSWKNEERCGRSFLTSMVVDHEVAVNWFDVPSERVVVIAIADTGPTSCACSHGRKHLCVRFGRNEFAVDYRPYPP